MSYMITTDEAHGRKSTQIDLPRFAADLAAALGGKLLPAGDYPREQQSIKIGADELSVRADTYKRRVNVYISAPEVPWNDRNTYDKAQRAENASINPDARDIKRIAADIKRRVIDASQEALRLQRKHAAELADARASIVRVADSLKKAMPGLDVRVNERERNATVYGGGNAHYVSARLNHDATVSIERLGSVTMDKFLKIMAILNAK